MPSKVLLTLTSLLGLTLALPASHPIPRTPWQQCAIGKSFYSCQNGYRGCYASDPCSLPPISSAPPPPPPPAADKQIQPVMYNLYFQKGAHDTDQLQHLDVRTATQRSLAWFDGVPKAAKRCMLKWRQPKEIKDRSLKVNESGLVSTRQLTGFPKQGEKINTVTLKPFVKQDWEANMDFTNWDKVPGTSPHMGPSLDCSITPIVVELSAERGDGLSGEVFIENKPDDGLYLEYEL